MPNLFIDPHIYDMTSSFGVGEVPADYAIVGLAPGANRPTLQRNQPFSAKSQQLYSELIKRIPGQRKLYMTNIVKTPKPTTERLYVKEQKEWLPRLLTELRLVKPRRVLALGGSVASALCPTSFESMSDDHGVLLSSSVLSEALGYNVIVVPTYPALSVNQDPTLRTRVNRDLYRFFTLPDPKPCDYVTVPTGTLPRFGKNARVYVDLETTGLDPFKGKITWLSFSTDAHDRVALIENPTTDDLLALRGELTVKNCTLVGFNLQFDLYWLSVHSNTDWLMRVEDVMLLAYNQGEESVGLKHLSTMYTDRPGPHAFGGFADAAYAAEDVHATKLVHRALLNIREPQPVDRLMNQSVPELVKMRRAGVFIDRPKLVELEAAFAIHVKRVQEQLCEYYGVDNTFNWRSTDSLGKLLKSNGVPLVEKTKTGKPKLTEDTLIKLAEADDRVKPIIELRGVEKTLTGFFQGYLQLTTDVHPFLHPMQDLKGASTGRTSMRDPNLQQVTRTGPSKLIFKSRWAQLLNTGEVWDIGQLIKLIGVEQVNQHISHNNLVCAGKIGLVDLDQAELRAVALLSGDTALMQSLLTSDPHRANAARVYKMKPEDVPATLRKRVKGVVFGLLYGGGAKGLALRVGVSEDEVNKVLREFFGQFPQLAKWLTEVKDESVRNLGSEDLFGRKRSFAKLMQDEGANSVKRKGCNTPVQALASHMAMTVLSQSSIELRKAGLLSCPMYGIHDSTILDIHPGDSVAAVANCVQRAFYSLNFTPLRELPLWRQLPITGELVIGSTWAAVESTSDYYSPDDNLRFKCSTHREPPPMNRQTEISLDQLTYVG